MNGAPQTSALQVSVLLGDGAQQEHNHLNQGKHKATTAPCSCLNTLQPGEKEEEETEKEEVTLRKYISRRCIACLTGGASATRGQRAENKSMVGVSVSDLMAKKEKKVKSSRTFS